MDYARLHLRFGWWSLLVFSVLGLTLEALQDVTEARLRMAN